MKIGIDIDGVLTNVIQYICDYGSKYFYDKYHFLNIDINSLSLEDMYGVTKEEDKACWLNLLENYSSKEPARPFASEIISKLKEEHHEIYIVTARCAHEWANLEGKMFQIVENWLTDNHIFYDKIIFSSDDKLDICIKNNIDIMIEDNSNNINRLSSKIPVICYHANHNQLCKGKNIYRAYSWYDVYTKIKQIETQN